MNRKLLQKYNNFKPINGLFDDMVEIYYYYTIMLDARIKFCKFCYAWNCAEKKNRENLQTNDRNRNKISVQISHRLF